MGIRKRSHGCSVDHGWLQTVPARGTVFDDKIRQTASNFVKKTVLTFNLSAKAFTQGVRIIATNTESLVVIHLEITKVAALQQANNLLREKINDPWIIEIPKPAIPHCKGNT